MRDLRCRREVHPHNYDARMTRNRAVVKVDDLERAAPNADLRGDVRVKRLSGSRVELMGWAIGRKSPVTRIEVVSAGAVVGSTTTGVSRPDLAKAFPDEPGAAAAGYEIGIDAGRKVGGELGVQAVLADGTRAPLGNLRVEPPRRRWRDMLRGS